MTLYKCLVYFTYLLSLLPLFVLKPRPHQQQRRSNIVECYTKSNVAST